MRPAEQSVAAFDSAMGMVKLLGAALHGHDLPRLGQSRVAAAGVRTTSALPLRLRRLAYARAGAGEGVPVDELGDVDLGAVARHVVDHYPSRRFPAALIGAANGGMTHLAAAAQVPFLPQTVLVPVRWEDNAPDRPDRAMAWGEHAARPLLAANPDVELHHMHDGNQDELMVSHMAYFRCKWTALPVAYRIFLERHLQPGAPIVLVAGGSRWPVTRVNSRHVFQNGAYGGLGPEDYARGPHAPSADEEAAEAEWGTTEDFEQSVRDWATAHGHPVLGVRSTDPQHLAARAATAYLEWRRACGVPRPRLVVDQFIQSQPWHVLRSGAVPFWTVFPVDHCADQAEEWIRTSGSFERVDVALFNHGAISTGLADLSRWQAMTQAGAHPGALLGQSLRRYPADFAALAHATPDFRKLADGPPWSALPVSALAHLTSP